MNSKPDTQSLDSWATDNAGPVAIQLSQTLQPVEGEGGVIFPPTYAGSSGDKPYIIDTLGDGRTVVTLDSVASQANRIEPMFKRCGSNSERDLSTLVPQIDIDPGEGHPPVSLLDVGHRVADAFVRSTELAPQVHEAFTRLLHSNDCSALLALAPTTLLFGAWDSRDTQAKLPRLLQSTIRAWDVDKLTTNAWYFPPVKYSSIGVLDKADAAREEGGDTKLSVAGFANASPGESGGGVIARGPIVRSLTINLIALRRLRGGDTAATEAIQRYLLSLALVAAAEPPELFLRQGCLLVPHPDVPLRSELVQRDGQRVPVELDPGDLYDYASAKRGGVSLGEDRTIPLDPKQARKLAAEAKKSKAG